MTQASAPDGTDPAPWTGPQRGALAALIAGALGTLPWTVHPWYDRVNDAALYVLTARSLATGDGYAYLGKAHTVRPPGFSALLAPVISVFGVDFFWLNLLVALFGVACIALLFVYFRPRLGTLLTTVTCAVLWLNPTFQRTCSQVMSDVPGAALMVASLIAARACSRRPSLPRYIGLGLLVAVAAYLRTINVLLVPAIAGAHLWSALRERDRRRPRLIGVAVLVALPVLAYVPWVVHTGSVRKPKLTEQLYLDSYWTAMWHVDAGDPDSPTISAGDLARRVRLRTSDVLLALGTRLGEPSSAWQRGVGLIGLLAWLGLLVRRRGETELLAGLLLALLVTYFAFRVRLVLPVFLLILPLTVEVARAVASRALGQRRGDGLLAIALAALAAVDFQPWPWRAEIEVQHERTEQVAEFLVQRYGERARFAAPIGWHLGVFLDQRVYSLRVLGDRVGHGKSLDLVAKYNVAAVVLDPSEDKDDRISEKYGEIIGERLPLEREIDRVRILTVPR